MLREMCQYSNNLYNVPLYNIRQYYFQEKKFLKYEENYHVCKENENYGLLQAGVSQQILKVADRSFKSFFNIIKKAKSGEYRFKDIKMPHYRKKGGMFNLILSTNAINVKDGFLTIPMSRGFSKLHDRKQIKIPFPARLKEKTIKEVVWMWTIFLSIILNSRILARSAGSVSTVACTSLPMAGLPMRM